jgi:hypothetical protein
MSMGKEAKNPSKSATPMEPPDYPNKKTRDAMAATERGEVTHCKDLDDLLGKLKS